MFEKTIHYFLNQNPGEYCPKAGHGAFADAVNHQPIVSEIGDDASQSDRYR